MTFTIEELPIPDEPTPDFVRAIAVGNEVEALGYGTPDLAYEPDEELAIMHNPHEPARLLVARVDGEIVALGKHETTVGDDSDTSWLAINVLPQFRRRGIGTALADALEGMARDEGKAKVVLYAPIAEGPGERLPSPTGFGSVVARDPGVLFLQQRGYTFEQVERLSRLPLPVAGIDGLVAAAQERSGPDYRLHTWHGATPERWRADIAELGTRMSTDAPTAGLEEPADVWTVERVIESDERAARESPRVRHTAAVEHVPTGRLVGYTVLSVPPQLHRAVDQYATIVMREHRGHKLGMLLKVGNLQHLAQKRPGHPSVMTFNAEENRHMLDVNEAVGFVAIANESAWRKDLR